MLSCVKPEKTLGFVPPQKLDSILTIGGRYNLPEVFCFMRGHELYARCAMCGVRAENLRAAAEAGMNSVYAEY